MTPKELKQLAKACREVGITTFEGLGVKFTLGVPPIKSPRRAKDAPALSQFEREVLKAQTPVNAAPIETDTPTQEELMYWSSCGPSGEDEVGL